MNLSLFQLIHSFADKSAFFDFIGILLAEYLPYVLVIACIFLAFRLKGKERLFFIIAVALSVIIARGVIAETIRFVFPTQRPYEALVFEPLVAVDSNAFPSGHASFFFALAGTIFYFNRKWGKWFLILALINGIARIFVGVHWPADILGGAAVGVLSSFLTIKLLSPALLSKASDVSNQEHVSEK